MTKFTQTGVLFNIEKNLDQDEFLHIIKGKVMSAANSFLDYEDNDNSKLINAVEIDWNSADFTNAPATKPTKIDTTGQLVSAIKWASTQGPEPGQGPTGVTGSQGATGDKGAQGTKGATGVTGSQGAAGNPGAQGNKGGNGVSGAQGATGDKGAQGTKGATGVTGSQGSPGKTGDQGKQGATGPTGAQGASGNKGSQGVSGDRGVTGPQGGSGPSGVTGNQGVRGAQGVVGPQGVFGPNNIMSSTTIGGARIFNDTTIDTSVSGNEAKVMVATGAKTDRVYAVQLSKTDNKLCVYVPWEGGATGSEGYVTSISWVKTSETVTAFDRIPSLQINVNYSNGLKMIVDATSIYAYETSKYASDNIGKEPNQVNISNSINGWYSKPKTYYLTAVYGGKVTSNVCTCTVSAQTGTMTISFASTAAVKKVAGTPMSEKINITMGGNVYHASTYSLEGQLTSLNADIKPRGNATYKDTTNFYTNFYLIEGTYKVRAYLAANQVITTDEGVVLQNGATKITTTTKDYTLTTDPEVVAAKWRDDDDHTTPIDYTCWAGTVANTLSLRKMRVARNNYWKSEAWQQLTTYSNDNYELAGNHTIWGLYNGVSTQDKLNVNVNNDYLKSCNWSNTGPKTIYTNDSCSENVTKTYLSNRNVSETVNLTNSIGIDIVEYESYDFDVAFGNNSPYLSQYWKGYPGTYEITYMPSVDNPNMVKTPSKLITVKKK